MGIKAWVPDIEIWIKIVGLLAAAVWAFFLLFYLRRRPQVDIDIRKKESDIEIQRMRLAMDLAADRINTEKKEFEIKELDLKTRPQISVAIDIQPNIAVDGEGYTLVATVAMTNHGNDATRISWEGEVPAFTVRAVTFDGEGRAQLGDRGLDFRVMQTRDPTQLARAHVVRAGATETLSFAARLSKSGLYLLSFRAATAGDVREEAAKYGVRLPTSWTAQRYVYVGKPPEEAAFGAAAAPDAEIAERERRDRGEAILAGATTSDPHGAPTLSRG